MSFLATGLCHFLSNFLVSSYFNNMSSTCFPFLFLSHLILRYSYMSAPFFSLLNLFYPILRNRSVSFFSLLFLSRRTLSNRSVAFFSLLFFSRFTLSNRSVTFFSQLYLPHRSFKNMSALFHLTLNNKSM